MSRVTKKVIFLEPSTSKLVKRNRWKLLPKVWQNQSGTYGSVSSVEHRCVVERVWEYPPPWKFFEFSGLKVTGGNLLIHAFVYSLFIGLCSVTFNMTGHSHSYHSIKLVRCGAPQRDVLSDKMVLWAATHSFYFHALPVFFIKYCHKLCFQRQMMVRPKHVSYLLYGKYLKKNSFIPSPHLFFIELNLKTLLCNQRGSPYKPGRMKSIIQKRIIQERTQSQDEKPSNQSISREVRRLGQVITFVVCAVFSLNFQTVVLLTKAAINDRLFSI